jgi:hypothetical protein
VTQEVLLEIRGWKTGILLINPEDSFGVNTRFASDAFVLVLANVENESMLRQFIGRSSRARGLCTGNYYPVTKLS